MGLYDIICVGSNTVDVFVKTDTEAVSLHYKIKREKGFVDKEKLSLAYPVGEKILINHLEFQTGGGGTNTAVAFSRLGLRTGYLGKIGEDDNGARIFASLKQEKVDFLGTLGETSGYSVILDSLYEDRTILAFKGCNDDLSFKELDLGSLKTKWFYFSSMMGESLKTMKKLAGFAARNKIRIAFNPANYLAEAGVREIEEILKASNVLILNKEEAELLSYKKTVEESLLFLKKYAKDYVVITDGSNGAYFFDGEKIYHAKPDPSIKIVETTGAGDGFASGFIGFLVYGEKLEKALKAGFIQAESVIQSYGSKNKLLSKKELLGKIARDKRKIVVSSLDKNYVPEDKWFLLCNGKKIRSLNDLATEAKTMPMSVFSHHATPQRNDFALWIQGVFSEAMLAKKIASAKTPRDLHIILNKHLKKKGG